jgi:hypothetical protein
LVAIRDEAAAVSDGERKNVKVTKLISTQPRKFQSNGKDRESWRVETDAGVIEVVQPAATPAPTVGEDLLLMVYPARGDYPPSGYPVQQGRGGGGQRGISLEHRQSIERQVAAKVTASLLTLVIEDESKTADQLAAAFAKVFDGVHGKITGGGS